MDLGLRLGLPAKREADNRESQQEINPRNELKSMFVIVKVLNQI